MINRGAQRVLTELVEAPPSVCIGQVSAIETSSVYGYLVTVTIRPTGDEVQARVATAGAGSGTGDWWPVAVGDEVVVLLPDGDPNRAVVWGWVPSSAALPPSSWTNAAPRLVHPSGKAFATTATAAPAPVVTQALLPDLQSALTEVQTALAGLGLPTTNLAALIAKLPASYRSKGVLSD